MNKTVGQGFWPPSGPPSGPRDLISVDIPNESRPFKPWVLSLNPSRLTSSFLKLLLEATIHAAS